jgi:hypothetical protein
MQSVVVWRVCICDVAFLASDHLIGDEVFERPIVGVQCIGVSGNLSEGGTSALLQSSLLELGVECLRVNDAAARANARKGCLRIRTCRQLCRPREANGVVEVIVDRNSSGCVFEYCVVLFAGEFECAVQGVWREAECSRFRTGAILTVGSEQPSKSDFEIHREKASYSLDLVGVESFGLEQRDLCSQHFPSPSIHDKNAEVGDLPASPMVCATKEVRLQRNNPLRCEAKRSGEVREVADQRMVKARLMGGRYGRDGLGSCPVDITKYRPDPLDYSIGNVKRWRRHLAIVCRICDTSSAGVHQDIVELVKVYAREHEDLIRFCRLDGYFLSSLPRIFGDCVFRLQTKSSSRAT